MKRLTFLAALLSTVASAQTNPPPASTALDSFAASSLRPQAGGPTKELDINTSDLTGHETYTDFELTTGIGTFSITRQHTNSTRTWSNVWLSPQWFGVDATYAATTGRVVWWSSLASHAIVIGTKSKDDPAYTYSLSIRDTSGATVSVAGIDFATANSSNTTTWVRQGSGNTRVIGVTSPNGANVETITLVRPGEGRFVYTYATYEQVRLNAQINHYYRLSAIYPDTNTADPICSFEYPNSTTGKVSGATCFGGYHVEVTWNAGVVSQLALNGTSVTAYGYDSGRLATVDYQRKLPDNSYAATRRLQYSYVNSTGAAGFTESVGAPNGTMLTIREKTYGGNVVDCSGNLGPAAVSSSRTQTSVYSYFPQAAHDCNSPSVSSIAETTYAGTVTRAYTTTVSGFVTRLEESCTVGNQSCYPPWNESQAWGVNTNLPTPTDSWYQGKTGFYLDSTAIKTTNSGELTATELQAQDAGATDAVGSNTQKRLTETYQYAYTLGPSATWEQLPASQSEESVVVPGQPVTTTWRYDLTTKVPNAVFRSGYTRDIANNAVAKTVATFFFTTKPCSGGGAVDEANRITEIHGPCFVSGTAANDCPAAPAGTYLPVTQLFYYPKGDGTTNAGRLRAKREFPRVQTLVCGSDYFETVYESYDAAGHVTSEVAPDGVRTQRIYSGSQLLSETSTDVDGKTWTISYGYDAAGHLKTKTLPNGITELTCYRKITDQANPQCGDSDGSPLSQPSMTAKIVGGAIVEKTFYTYRQPAGALVGGGILAQSDKNGPGAQSGHPAAPFVSATRAVDIVGQEVALGNPLFNQTSSIYFKGQLQLRGSAFTAPAGCDVLQPGTCTAFAYTRLGQVASIVSPLGASTNFAYDAQGHVRDVTDTPNSANTPAKWLATYASDDFGNLVTVSGRWMSGITRQTFDARGNVVQKQLPGASGPTSFAYDGASRVLSATSSGGVKLWAYGYDATMPSDISGSAATNCKTAAEAKTVGRIRWKDDSFGRTWYEYNGRGQVTAQRRVRAGALVCSTTSSNSSDATPDSTYQYDSVGRMTAVKYPHGRWVGYSYRSDLPDRVLSIYSNLTGFSGGFAASDAVVTGIAYGVDGAVAGYQTNTSPIATVDYLRFGNASQQATGTAPTTCTSTLPQYSGDKTGRLTGVWIQRNSNVIFQRQFVWRYDQLDSESTCMLDDVTPTTVSYSYDSDLQVTGAQRPSGQFAASGGVLANRNYVYLGAQRQSVTEDDATWSYTYDPQYPDHVASIKPTTPSWAGRTYSYNNATGAVSTIVDAPLPNGQYGTQLSFTSDDAFAGVYKAIVVNGGTYEYLYDISGHRRLKKNPAGLTDEFFYEDNTLIEDRGVARVQVAGAMVLNEYVWLSGMPVAVFKSNLSSSYARAGTTDCTRNDVAETCGTYFIVSDYLPKPIAMLDSNARIVGTGDYDVFGNVNSVKIRRDVPAATGTANTPGAYLPNQNVTLATLKQPWRGSQQRVQMRVDFAQVNTASIDDRVWVETSLGFAAPAYSATPLIVPDADGYPMPIVQTFYSGQRGRVLSNWFDAPSEGSATVRWTSSATQAGTQYTGATLSKYEYRRFESGASSLWIPIAFPGQYSDDETTLRENWNRFYDPNNGVYLSTDPITPSPTHLDATYAYAGNNPLTHTDVDGRQDANDKRSELGANAVNKCLRTGDKDACAAADVVEVQAAVSAIMVGGAALYYAVAEAQAGVVLRAGAVKVAKAVKSVAKNIDIDGPSAGFVKANEGRIVGLRWKKKWGVRLDYHKLPGYTGKVLHINFGPAGRGEAAHIVVWAPEENKEP